MFKQLGMLDIVCDAPSYDIVRASRLLGLTRPEDVRWFRLNSYTERHLASRWKTFLRRTWEAIFGKPKYGSSCSCGESLPLLQEHVFLLPTGIPVIYLIGQCPRCLTVYWDDVPPASLL